MSYSPNDHGRLVNYIEERWGPNQRAWASPKLWEEFAEFTTGCVFQSIHEMFTDGRRYAPNAAELKSHCRDVQRRRWASGEDPAPGKECAGRCVWGVVHYAGEYCIGGECSEFEEHQMCAVCESERRLRRTEKEKVA